MPQNEQKPDKSNLRCKKDELQQITRQNDKMKMQDEKTMIYVGKPHETTCSDSHIINDVKKMRKQFSQRRSAD